jgi:hypothetical protein
MDGKRENGVLDGDRIAATKTLDTSGILARLDDLIRQADDLPLQNDVAQASATRRANANSSSAVNNDRAPISFRYFWVTSALPSACGAFLSLSPFSVSPLSASLGSDNMTSSRGASSRSSFMRTSSSASAPSEPSCCEGMSERRGIFFTSRVVT